MKRLVGILLSGAALVGVAGAHGQTAKPRAPTPAEKGIAVNPQLASREWPTYGHDSGGMRYAPLTQITPANVTKLQVAWSYHMKPADFTAPAGGRSGFAARTNTQVTEAP